MSSSLKEPDVESCLALYLSKMVPAGFFAARAVNGSNAAVTRERSFMAGSGVVVVVQWLELDRVDDVKQASRT